MDEFAAILRSDRQDLEWNGQYLPNSDIKSIFITGLGQEFTRINECTMSADHPAAFQTDNLEHLVTAARNFLSNIMAVRRCNKLAHDQHKAEVNTEVVTKPSDNKTKSDKSKQQPVIPPKTPSSSTSAPDRPQHQKDILREIGLGVHTPERIAYWQSLSGSSECYYHRTSNHMANMCAVIKGVTEKAKLNPAVPQARSATPHDKDNSKVTFLIDNPNDPVTPKSQRIDIPQIQDNQWDSENYYKIIEEIEDSDSDNAPTLDNSADAT